MPLLVVGSVALDSVETPSETRDDLLGGSGSYFSVAASYFTPVQLVGVVGDDWPEEHTKMLQSHGVDTAGLETIEGEATFRWKGKYHENMNDRDTLDVQLGAMTRFDPTLPDNFRQCPFIFLANDPPPLQIGVLEQCSAPKLVVADTMDLWINTERETLLKLLKKIDAVVLNDSEAKLLTGESNMPRAAREVQKLGPSLVVIKKGEHGCMLLAGDRLTVLPAYPTETVIDPTGAGDSFAGGMMGYLAEQDTVDTAAVRRSLAYGTVVASFTVEDFSLDRLANLTREEIDARLAEYMKIVAID